jgi:23S rRNA pseudouridine1911/1915/1917 synthase
MKRYTITDEWAGARIDRLVRALYPSTPFHAVQALLRRGKVTLNGKRVRGNTRLAVGDVVAFLEAETGEGSRHLERDGITQREWGSIGGEIAVLYEDDDVLVIDKPRGIVVQPGNRKELGSLLDLLEAYRLQRVSPGAAPSDDAEPAPFPYTPVHRLDRETTGALVVAKTRRAARVLSKEFVAGRVEKRYLALVEGVPPAERGTVEVPLRVEKNRRSTASPDAKGKAAETTYSLVSSPGGGRSLLEVRITTGRTHQIRAHLAGIGNAIVGDSRYGTGGRTEGGLHLHAWRISFPHPRGADVVHVTSPPPVWARER